MSAPKQLKDLPGFDEAFADVLDIAKPYMREATLLVGAVVLPVAIGRVDIDLVDSLVRAIAYAMITQRQRLRLVPPPKPRTMNARQLGGWYARVLGSMDEIAARVSNDRRAVQ